jgi:hypothetical protein
MAWAYRHSRHRMTLRRLIRIHVLPGADQTAHLYSSSYYHPLSAASRPTTTSPPLPLVSPQASAWGEKCGGHHPPVGGQEIQEGQEENLHVYFDIVTSLSSSSVDKDPRYDLTILSALCIITADGAGCLTSLSCSNIVLLVCYENITQQNCRENNCSYGTGVILSSSNCG